MVVFNEAYFRIPIIGHFSFVCAENRDYLFEKFVRRPTLDSRWLDIMLFEALVLGFDPGSPCLKDASDSGLILRTNRFVTTAHTDYCAISEMANESGMKVLQLGNSYLPIAPNQTPSELSEFVLVIEGAMIVASGGF